jgi:aryl carrier-like protein
MEHRAVSAIWTLRQRARRLGTADVAMPVVFTSALGLPSGLVDLDLPFGRPVWGLSQTPQVWLDCQVTERGGALFVNWDAVEELFPPGVLDGMFADFVGLLERLVAGDWGVVAGMTPVAHDPVRPDSAAPESAEPPRGPVETTVATIWARLLDVTPIHRHHNFFALGGDSILATELVTELRQRLGAPVTLRQLLDAPTLAELSTLVAADVEEGEV